MGKNIPYIMEHKKCLKAPTSILFIDFPPRFIHQHLIPSKSVPGSSYGTCRIYGGDMVSAGIIERKLRRTKVRLFTVPCCSIILFSSEGVEKKKSDLPPNFFRRSIILVGALLFYNSVFPHFSHISHFRSIINFPRAPFYN